MSAEDLASLLTPAVARGVSVQICRDDKNDQLTAVWSDWSDGEKEGLGTFTSFREVVQGLFLDEIRRVFVAMNDSGTIFGDAVELVGCQRLA